MAVALINVPGREVVERVFENLLKQLALHFGGLGCAGVVEVVRSKLRGLVQTSYELSILIVMRAFKSIFLNLSEYQSSRY